VRDAGVILLVFAIRVVSAQDGPPTLRAGPASARIVIDGQLTETAWESAEAAGDFRQTDPVEGASPSAHTRVQVLADTKAIVIGSAWNPRPIVTVEFSGERNVGQLATGEFAQTVAGTRLRVNFSPDLSFASYIQYDTDSESVGTNTRLRWSSVTAARRHHRMQRACRCTSRSTTFVPFCSGCTTRRSSRSS
jgi:hypothetical protein